MKENLAVAAGPIETQIFRMATEKTVPWLEEINSLLNISYIITTLYDNFLYNNTSLNIDRKSRKKNKKKQAEAEALS